jgi:hypothetical protein
MAATIISEFLWGTRIRSCDISAPVRSIQSHRNLPITLLLVVLGFFFRLVFYAVSWL